MWYRTIMVLLMVITIGYPNWRWANDSMEMTFDKEAHLAASFGLYYMFKYKGFSDRESILYTTSLGLTKETIDALFPWEKYGRLGGDGFSKNDLDIDNDLHKMSRQQLCRYMDAVLPEKGFFELQSTTKIRLGCQLLRNFHLVKKQLQEK